MTRDDYAHIDVGHATNEQLQLTLVEHIDEISRDELEQAIHERIELLLHALGDSILHDEIDIFLLVFLSDIDVLASRLQLELDELAKPILCDREGFVENVGDLVLPATALSTPAAMAI